MTSYGENRFPITVYSNALSLSLPLGNKSIPCICSVLSESIVPGYSRTSCSWKSMANTELRGNGYLPG